MQTHNLNWADKNYYCSEILFTQYHTDAPHIWLFLIINVHRDYMFRLINGHFQVNFKPD